MNKYDRIQRIGQGSYGTVIKCRHRETGTLVAIKRSLDTEDNPYTKKAATREIKMLQKLHHDNIVNLIEAFIYNKRYHLVLEYMDHTLLREIEECKSGLGVERTREYFYQIAQGVGYCHSLRMLHRDVKPENILVSHHGIVKLCDFGLARRFVKPNDTISVEVGTQYYNAPELLIKATDYGCEVDVWAMGCVFAEMMNGKPLFQGEIGSETDQLHIVMKLLGQLPPCYEKLLNPRAHKLTAMKKYSPEEVQSALCKLFPTWSTLARDLLQLCIKLVPGLRPTSHELLMHPYFTNDSFGDKFSIKLTTKIKNVFSNVSSTGHKPADHGDGLATATADRSIESHDRRDVTCLQKVVKKRNKTKSQSRDLADPITLQASHQINEHGNGSSAINVDNELSCKYSQSVKALKIPKLKLGTRKHPSTKHSVQKQKKSVSLKPKRIPSQLFQRFKSRLNKKLTPSVKSKAIGSQFSSSRCNNTAIRAPVMVKTQVQEVTGTERSISLKMEKRSQLRKYYETQGFVKPLFTQKQADPRNCGVPPVSVQPYSNMQKLNDMRKCYGAKPSVKPAGAQKRPLLSVKPKMLQRHELKKSSGCRNQPVSVKPAGAQKRPLMSVKPKMLPRHELKKLNGCRNQPGSVKAQKGKRSCDGVPGLPGAKMKEPKKTKAIPKPQWRY